MWVWTLTEILQWRMLTEMSWIEATSQWVAFGAALNAERSRAMVMQVVEEKQPPLSWLMREKATKMFYQHLPSRWRHDPQGGSLFLSHVFKLLMSSYSCASSSLEFSATPCTQPSYDRDWSGFQQPPLRPRGPQLVGADQCALIWCALVGV